jgi:hypothetical protein
MGATWSEVSCKTGCLVVHTAMVQAALLLGRGLDVGFSTAPTLPEPTAHGTCRGFRTC